jgi:UDP-4-amino-4,6-dideoxy-N-acetyl-beta-L-altrosamine transaminase
VAAVRVSAPPFLPYARQLLDEDDIAAVVDVLRSEYLTTGPAIGRFEEALADRVGAKWAVTFSNGTSALHAACFAAAMKPGDHAIVPAITFVATANCARYLGAEPVFADVDPRTGLVVPEAVSERLTDRTRAILVVDLGGAPVDVAPVAALASRAGAVLIEDAAHALGASRGGTPVGRCSDGPSMAMFSFHPVKHVTTGEGGAVTGNDDALRERLRLFRDHGIERRPERFTSPSPGPWYYEQQHLGHNFRLTDIQAALGLSQLRKLDRFLERRRMLAARYDRLLRDVAWVEPVVVESGSNRRAQCAYHLYQVLIDFTAAGTSRASVMQAMRARGIGTNVHYIPLPMQPYYRNLGWDPAAFPGASQFYERTLSLPLFPGMKDDDVDRVVDSLRIILSAAGGS